MGEGWLLTGEMLELIDSEAFPTSSARSPSDACPTTSCGKGMIRPLKDDYPDTNIVAIDYDPSASERSIRRTASS